MFNLNVQMIRRLFFARGLTVREFARQAGINPLTASKVLRPGATVTIRTLGKLAQYFGVDGNELILKEA